MITKHDIDQLSDRILADLDRTPKGRFYRDGVSQRLRDFIEKYLADKVEIVRHDRGHLVRRKK